VIEPPVADPFASTAAGSTPAPLWVAEDWPWSPARTLARHRVGRHDPTARLTASSFLRAAITPEGPGTLLVRWRTERITGPAQLDAAAWGPGAGWLLAGVGALAGGHDRTGRFDDTTAPVHPRVAASLRERRDVRLGASGDLYHALLHTIVEQRITSGEAIRQWGRLCRRLGEPAPGPAPIVAGLRLPPAPGVLAGRPLWWFHPLGIEEKRARPLVTVARHADRLWEWAAAGSAVAAAKLALLPGVGPWTVGSVLGPALGDPDAVAVGDYHLPNTVAWALAREPRGDDARMLELLAPYAGQRGRVLGALAATAGRAPAFGPRRRVLPMHRW
jgi:3-methyladenine DNA glycosylase/8-oxoguanine DNA glycosylase